MRFKYVQNELTLEKRLNEIWIGDFMLRVHLAKKGRRQEVDSVTGNGKTTKEESNVSRGKIL